MDAPSLPAENTSHLPVPRNQDQRHPSIWSMPLGSALAAFLNNRDAIGRFLSLTGGSILYCLSALSIVYGITQIIGPPLAKSGVLADILPCVAVLNVYELALLAVLVLIVVWRHVTDDAISLVILVALFLVASGMTLGVVAPSGLNICLVIGFVSVVLGFGKLYVLRRYISLHIGMLSALGLALILMWNFLGSSLMARPIMARTATDELRRSQWLFSWLVVMVGAALIFVEAARSKYAQDTVRDRRPAFLHTSAMAWVFALVLLAAAGFHQYGVAYMFAIDYVHGDFLPLIAVMSLLLLELVRSLGKRRKSLEVLSACVPLGLTVFAVPNKLTTIPASIGLDAIVYPPVVLGLTGSALLWMGVRRRCSWLRFVAPAYALGVLLTMSRSHDFNVRLFGGGLVIVLLAFGVILRNVHLCFAGVVTATIGLGTTDALAEFAKAHDLTAAGATVGVGALGIVALALAFGRRTPALYVLLGTLAAIVCIFDFLPKSLHWVDLAVFLVIGVLFAALLRRTRNVAPALVLWIPVFPRAYLLVARMSSWNFVVLSFLLLLLGALVSLFLKQKLLPESPASSEPPRQTSNPLSEDGT